MFKPFLTLLLASLLAACSLNPVNTDYDPSVPFDGIGRYAWAPAPADTPTFPSLDHQRIHAAVDNALAQHAMRPVEAADAQLWVQGGIELREVRDVSTMEMGTAHWQPLLIGGETIVHVDKYTEAHIFVQFISPKDARVVWKGKLTTRWNEGMAPDKREKLLQDAVFRILAAFPPQPGR